MKPPETIQRIRQCLWKGTEPLLLFLVVYAPWALNSQPYPFSLGLHLLVLLFAVLSLLGAPPEPIPPFAATTVGKLLVATAILFLLYVLVSILNARADAIFGGSGVGLQYFESIPWLPQSYSRRATREEWLWQVPLTCAFFGACKWMRSQAVQRRIDSDPRSSRWTPGLKRLLWVVSVSSGLMAVEAIGQRLSHSDNLLFLYPRYTWRLVVDGTDTLGPFPYQGTGTAYFNLIWPLTLGLWWTNQLREYRQTGVRPRFGTQLGSVLPILTVLMILCIFVTTSRAGVATCLAEMLVIGVIVLRNRRRIPGFLKIGILVSGLLIAGSVAYLGLDPILRKIERLKTDQWGDRLPVYRQVLRMIPDFDPWGGGAASFSALNDLYTDPTADNWESMVHNEWLEARFSYGKIGFGILVVLVVLGILQARSNRLAIIPSAFVPFLLVALTGICVDACVDIPFQTRSLHFLFVLCCAIALYATPKSAKTTSETL